MGRCIDVDLIKAIWTTTTVANNQLGSSSQLCPTNIRIAPICTSAPHNNIPFMTLYTCA